MSAFDMTVLGSCNKLTASPSEGIPFLSRDERGRRFFETPAALLKGCFQSGDYIPAYVFRAQMTEAQLPVSAQPMGYPTNPMIRDVITIMIMPNRYIWLRLLYSCPWSMAMVAKEEGSK